MSPMVKTPLTLELALLGFLVVEPMHAYEMYRRLHDTDALALIWRIKQSQLYALLARLEDEGYIEAETEAQGSRPPRRMLHLTPGGRAAFDEWLTTPVHRGRELRQEFLAKLYFAQQVGPEAAARLVAAQRQTCAAALHDAEQRAETLAAAQPYAHLVYRFRAGQLAASLAWLDECVATASLR